MNRAALRNDLRRRLQEEVPDRWTDVQLDSKLNQGLVETQKEIMKVDPEAFSYIDRADVVAGQEYYEWPDGMWYDRELGFLGSDGRYVAMERINFNERNDAAHTLSSVGRYARFDRERFVLCPVPTTSVVNGLEIVWVPTLTMASDNDVPVIHLGLHVAIVAFAEILALADVGDTSEETLKDLARMINSIPQYYIQSASTPARWTVGGINKGY